MNSEYKLCATCAPDDKPCASINADNSVVHHTNASKFTRIDHYLCVFGAICCVGLVACETCFSSCCSWTRKREVEPFSWRALIVQQITATHCWHRCWIFWSEQSIESMQLNDTTVSCTSNDLCQTQVLILPDTCLDLPRTCCFKSLYSHTETHTVTHSSIKTCTRRI